jgi:antitoxin component YwqK of YwqJK toxin-antitoxin module
LGQLSLAQLKQSDVENFNWAPVDFITRRVNKIEAYSYGVDKNGRLTDKRKLLFKKEFSKSRNEIVGVDCLNYIQGSKPQRIPNKFRYYYDTDGRIIQSVIEGNKVRIPDLSELTLIIDSIQFSYLNCKLAKETNTTKEDIQSFFPNSSDTSQWSTEHARSSEYTYDEKGREIKKYFLDDSTHYFDFANDKTISHSVKCSGCNPKYLSSELFYYENDKPKIWIWYTRDGKIHSKKYYYYNNKNRLIQLVDSTGWYIGNKPTLASITSFKYADTFLIEKQEVEENGSLIKKYDLAGNETQVCWNTDSSEDCTNSAYNYKDNKLISVFSENKFIKIEHTYLYYENGLLREKRTLHNGKLEEVIRYFY